MEWLLLLLLRNVYFELLLIDLFFVRNYLFRFKNGVCICIVVGFFVTNLHWLQVFRHRLHNIELLLHLWLRFSLVILFHHWLRLYLLVLVHLLVHGVLRLWVDFMNLVVSEGIMCELFMMFLNSIFLSTLLWLVLNSIVLLIWWPVSVENHLFLLSLLLGNNSLDLLNFMRLDLVDIRSYLVPASFIVCTNTYKSWLRLPNMDRLNSEYFIVSRMSRNR